MNMEITQVKTVLHDSTHYHDKVVNELLNEGWEIKTTGFTNGKVGTILVKYEFEDEDKQENEDENI